MKRRQNLSIILTAFAAILGSLTICDSAHAIRNRCDLSTSSGRSCQMCCVSQLLNHINYCDAMYGSAGITPDDNALVNCAQTARNDAYFCMGYCIVKYVIPTLPQF